VREGGEQEANPEFELGRDSERLRERFDGRYFGEEERIRGSSGGAREKGRESYVEPLGKPAPRPQPRVQVPSELYQPHPTSKSDTQDIDPSLVASRSSYTPRTPLSIACTYCQRRKVSIPRYM